MGLPTRAQRPPSVAGMRLRRPRPAGPRCNRGRRRRRARVPPHRAPPLPQRPPQLYEAAWSSGDIRLLDAIMEEDHRQLDVVWQPGDGGSGGRRRLKRGILAYRAAYPDIK
jgi:hypothetical protein